MKKFFTKLGNALAIILVLCLMGLGVGAIVKHYQENNSESDTKQEQSGDDKQNEDTDKEESDGDNNSESDNNSSDGETLPTDVEVAPSAVTFNTEENGVALVSTPLLASEYEVNGVAENAISAVTITATVIPESATDKRLQWDIDFCVLANDTTQSSWYALITEQGYNINDYVVVAPSEDTLSAVVSCLQPFGCTIRMKVSAVSNENAYANVIFNYNIGIVGATLSCVSVQDSTVSLEMPMSDLSLTDIDNFLPTNEIISSDNANYTITPSLTSTAGTCTSSTYLFEISLNSSFLNFMSEKGYEFNNKINLYPTYSGNFNFFYGALYFLRTDGKDYTQSSADGAALTLLDFGSSSKTYYTFEFLQQWNADVNEYIAYMANLGGSAPVQYTIKLVEYETEDGVGTALYGLSFYSWNSALYPVTVEDIELSQTDVVF